MSDARRIVEKLAAALDADDYGTARTTFHPHVSYTDVLTIDEETHVHFARQDLTVDTELGITHIVNVDLPGEREKVDAFMARHGRSRD